MSDNNSQKTTIDDYIQKLSVTYPLRESILRKIIKELQLPRGSRVMDVGCGIGLQTLLFAEAVGSEGHVIGIDICLDFLRLAEQITADHKFEKRVSFQKGDMNVLPFPDQTFDLLISVDCAGYPARKPIKLVTELNRVIKPGGSIVLVAWSSQLLLPGYPLLEARLNATSGGIGPFSKDMSPEMHFTRASGWFQKIGLKEITAKTYIDTVSAPLTSEMRNAMIALIQMRWVNVESELAPEDWQMYQRICMPGSPDFILNLPDYYAFFTYSLFHAKKT